MDAINTMPLRLRQDDSRDLIAALENQEFPWSMSYLGNGIFEVWVDGTPTAHTLDLSSQDGMWCMRTHIQI